MKTLILHKLPRKIIKREDISLIQKNINLPNVNFEEIINDFTKKKLDLLTENIKTYSSRKEKTLFITRYFKKYFENYKCSVFLEVQTEEPKSKIKEKFSDITPSYNKYYKQNMHKYNKDIFGYIDMRIVSKNQVLDIEIDSTNKKWSIIKLLYSRETLNHNILWIRHSVKVNPVCQNIIKKLNINTIELV
jgi:hypothetical protein